MKQLVITKCYCLSTKVFENKYKKLKQSFSLNKCYYFALRYFPNSFTDMKPFLQINKITKHEEYK